MSHENLRESVMEWWSLQRLVLHSATLQGANTRLEVAVLKTHDKRFTKN